MKRMPTGFREGQTIKVKVKSVSKLRPSNAIEDVHDDLLNVRCTIHPLTTIDISHERNLLFSKDGYAAANNPHFKVIFDAAIKSGYKLAEKRANDFKDELVDFLLSEIIERRDYSASKMCEEVIKFIEHGKEG